MKPKEKDPFLGVSSRGYALRCPRCGSGRLELIFVRDGSQAYWCHGCERGNRVGEMPLEGFYRLAEMPVLEPVLKSETSAQSAPSRTEPQANTAPFPLEQPQKKRGKRAAVLSTPESKAQAEVPVQTAGTERSSVQAGPRSPASPRKPRTSREATPLPRAS